MTLPDEVKNFLLDVANAHEQSELNNLRTEAALLLQKYVMRSNGVGPREFKDLPVITVTPILRWD